MRTIDDNKSNVLGTKARKNGGLTDLYAPQTKILEGRANIRERIFKALSTYVSTRFGLRSFEKCFKNYAPQTKILEGRTNISERIFEALFNVV
jgi:hypothetical protein